MQQPTAVLLWKYFGCERRCRAENRGWIKANHSAFNNSIWKHESNFWQRIKNSLCGWPSGTTPYPNNPLSGFSVTFQAFSDKGLSGRSKCKQTLPYCIPEDAILQPEASRPKSENSTIPSWTSKGSCVGSELSLSCPHLQRRESHRRPRASGISHYNSTSERYMSTWLRKQGLLGFIAFTHASENVPLSSFLSYGLLY